MDTILQRLSGVISYINDILTTGTIEREHLDKSFSVSTGAQHSSEAKEVFFHAI